VTVLLLAEEGKLALDDKISRYLPAEYLSGLANWEKITVRQLLQHTSGLYNYISSPHFQTASLNDLTKDWHAEELLSYARHQPAVFEPGTDAQYSNTNYILLGELISTICGKPFYEVFNEKLFVPLKLHSTRFAATDPVPDGIIQGYADFYGNLNLINTTMYSGWDYYTADGGLISNAYDLNRFLTALFQGETLTSQSMAAMTGWIAPGEQDDDGFETYYGLGIFKIVTDFGPAYLHSGDAIGYFASMVYFPDQQTTIAWAVNGNYGALDEISQSKEAMNRIFETVFEE
jgi:D-alanyl-D-alanine carboxypeptidase